jgi:acetyltransferase
MEGYRDHPPVNIERVAETLVRLSYLVAHHPAIRELDINPLLADANGVVALDARVKVADQVLEPRTPMAIRAYPSEWQLDFKTETLGNVRIRPIRPEDASLYQTFFSNVTVDDRRLRFFGAGRKITDAFVAQLTQIDYAREMAFVAIARDTGALLGVVRLVVDPSYASAEFAVLVRSDLKGRGLGRSLMDHLITYARSVGLRELHGVTLAGNHAMLKLSSGLGFVASPQPDDPAVLGMSLRL